MTTTIHIDHLYKAQFGEDRILWQVFGGRANGFFIEVGAYDGVTLSNTFFLEKMGWHGLLIEPIEALCQQADQNRGRSKAIHAACSGPGSSGTTTFTVAVNVPVLSFLTADEEHVERCKREGANLVQVEVPLTSLDAILLDSRKRPDWPTPWQANKGWKIDLVSIDTEGNELAVLDGFNLDRYKPRILLIENDRPTGEGIEPYLKDRGYRKFHRQKINDFYIRDDDPADDLKLSGFVIPQ